MRLILVYHKVALKLDIHVCFLSSTKGRCVKVQSAVTWRKMTVEIGAPQKLMQMETMFKGIGLIAREPLVSQVNGYGFSHSSH